MYYNLFKYLFVCCTCWKGNTSSSFMLRAFLLRYCHCLKGFFIILTKIKMELFTNIILFCICRTFLSCTKVRILHTCIYIWICFAPYKIKAQCDYLNVSHDGSLYLYSLQITIIDGACAQHESWTSFLIFNISIFKSLIFKNKAFTKQNTYRLVTGCICQVVKAIEASSLPGNLNLRSKVLFSE